MSFYLARKVPTFRCSCKSITCIKCPKCQQEVKGHKYPKKKCPLKCEICLCECRRQFNENTKQTKKSIRESKTSRNETSFSDQVQVAKEVAAQVLESIGICLFFSNFFE